MATFHLDLGNGDVVEVRAKTEAEAQRLALENSQTLPRVLAYTETGNGRILIKNGKEYFVSEGYSTSDPEKIAKVKEGAQPVDLAQSMVRQGVLQEAEDQLVSGRRTGPILAATQAAGFGAGSWVDEFLDATVGGKSGASVRAIQEAQRQERPIETLGVQLGTGLAEGVGVATAFPKIAGFVAGSREAGLLPSIARGFGTGVAAGATTGAISGAGEALPDEKIDGLKRGAIAGSVTGGLFGAATPVASAGGRNVMEFIRRTDIPMIAAALNISNDAARIIKETFVQGGDTQAALAGIERAGQQGMLADAGYAAQALLDASIAASPQAGQQAKAAITERAQKTSESLGRTLDKSLGDKELTPKKAFEFIAEKTKNERSDAYNAAYQKPIDYSSPKGMMIEDVIDRIDPDIVKTALAKANAKMKWDKVKNQQIMASIQDDGSVVFTRPLNVQQLDYIKRALNDMSVNARGEFGKQTPDSILYGDMAASLRQALGDAVPEYNAAVRLGGDKIAEENAFKLGRNALNPKIQLGDVIDELGSNPSAAEIDMAKLGMRNYIRGVLSNVRKVPSDMDIDARQLDEFIRLTSSDNARSKIRQIMGDEADELLKEIDKVSQTTLVRATTSVNSKTAQRSAIKEFVDGTTEFGAFAQLMRAEPLQSSQQLIQAITGFTDEYSEARKRQIYNDIARAMTETQGSRAKNAIRLLDRAVNGQMITQKENDALVRSIAASISIMGRTGTRPEVQEKLPR